MSDTTLTLQRNRAHIFHCHYYRIHLNPHNFSDRLLVFTMADSNSSVRPSTIDQYFVHPIGSSTLYRIKIPVPFFKRFDREEHGKQTVTLISHQTSREWKVKREGRTLRGGWEKFTKHCNLKVNDQVIFKHKGNSVFEVTTVGPSGSQINYTNIKVNRSRNHSGNQAGEERKQPQAMEEAGTSAKRKKGVAMDKMDTESPFMQAEGPKAYKKTELAEPNTFYQTVTKSNIERNSVSIPASFVNIHGLKSKLSEVVVLTNKEGDVWEATGTLCVDGRLNIGRGWSVFCAENNIQPGDRCKINLVEDPEHIILELTGLLNESNKAYLSPSQSEPRLVFKEQCSTSTTKSASKAAKKSN